MNVTRCRLLAVLGTVVLFVPVVRPVRAGVPASLPAAHVLTPAARAAAVRRLVTILGAIHTFSARFVQTVHDPALATVRRRKGLVWIARPGRFAWIYGPPSPEKIIADGKKIWVYEEELEQVTVRPEKAALGRRPDLLLAGSADVRRLYRVSYEGVVGRTAWYVLRPRKRGPFVRVALGLRDGVPVAMRLRDRLGERTDLRFSRVVINAPVPARRFRFHPPPGTAVLGAG